MAMVLEYTRDWLREKNGWNYTNCGVHYDAIPPLEAASPFYVSIDDAGVETGGNDDTDSLIERLTISIGIWRKPEHLHADRRGMMKLPADLYIAGCASLNDIERAIIVHKTATGYIKNGLHKNYQFVNGLNARYNLPDEKLGDKFIYPWIYRGKGRSDDIGTVDGNGNVQTWTGYRMRFSKLGREQRFRGQTDCIG